jgi:hypothetical protein
MRLVTRIKQGKDHNGHDMWVVGVEDTDANKVVATLPCSSDDQAEVVAQQVEKLISYLAGQIDLGGAPPEGSA